MIRVDEMTLEKFNEDQRSALKQANMERTTRGLRNWLIADYVRVHPDKFPDVDYETDHAEHKARVSSAPEPGPERVDQRAVR